MHGKRTGRCAEAEAEHALLGDGGCSGMVLAFSWDVLAPGCGCTALTLLIEYFATASQASTTGYWGCGLMVACHSVSVHLYNVQCTCALQAHDCQPSVISFLLLD